MFARLKRSTSHPNISVTVKDISDRNSNSVSVISNMKIVRYGLDLPGVRSISISPEIDLPGD
jgi:hypothetical protein